MRFRRQTLDAIARGTVTMAFRRWRQPRVRPGSRLRTAVGVLAVDTVEVVDVAELTAEDARAAGYPSLDSLLDHVGGTGDGRVYRMSVRLDGPDPRVALRERRSFTPDELQALRDRLARLDAASRHGPWTLAVLRMIAERPGVRAPDLASDFRRETRLFKADVRKLKELGLTESLEVGYRLSPRGRSFLATADGSQPPADKREGRM